MSKVALANDGGGAVVRAVAPALAVVAGVLALLSVGLPESLSRWVFSEQGPIELATIWLWVALGGVLLAFVRPLTPAVIAGAYICLCCAMREADWHKEFTGYSVMKVHFYYMPEHPVGHRLLAAAVVLPLIVSLVVVGVALVKRALGTERRAVPLWLVLSVCGGALLVVTKALDRVPGMLEDFSGAAMAPSVLGVFTALEEGFELLLPVGFGAAALALSRGERRRRREAEALALPSPFLAPASSAP